MKRLAIILTVVAATALLFSSCGKYEEGPSFSLLTKTARLTGDWTMVEMTIDGDVQDMEGVVSKTTLEKDGTGSFSYSMSGFTLSSDLEWEFDDAKENLKTRQKDMTSGEFGEWESAEIIRLTNSECWLRTTETIATVEVVTIMKMEKE